MKFSNILKNKKSRTLKKNKTSRTLKKNKTSRILKKNKTSRTLKTKKPKIFRKSKIPRLIVKQKIPNEKIDKKEGHFFDSNYYNKVIKNSCDVYYKDQNGNLKCLLKFRKKVIPMNECKNAFTALYEQAQKLNSNRGSAAGLLDKKRLPSYAKNITKQDKFRVYYKDANGKLKKDNIGNIVKSNIIGYYDQPDRNLVGKMKNPPQCRQTSFTRDEVEKWHSVLPLLKSINNQFKSLTPNEYKKQYQRCNETPKYKIKDTAFSTVTVNYNYRSACHKDAGDYPEGFGNLIVLEKDKCTDGNICQYEGGYLGFPKYKIAVDVRQGDFLAMDVHEWHCNCKLICKNCNNTECNGKIENKIKSDKEHYGRLSLVCYLRNGMIKCKNK